MGILSAIPGNCLSRMGILALDFVRSELLSRGGGKVSTRPRGTRLLLIVGDMAQGAKLVKILLFSLRIGLLGGGSVNGGVDTGLFQLLAEGPQLIVEEADLTLVERLADPSSSFLTSTSSLAELRLIKTRILPYPLTADECGAWELSRHLPGYDNLQYDETRRVKRTIQPTGPQRCSRWQGHFPEETDDERVGLPSDR